MKILFVILLFINFYPARATEKIVQEEGNFYGTTLRERELEEQLLTSDLYKKCKEQFKNEDLNNRANEINDCVKTALNSASDDDIKTLAEKADLASINQEQTKTAKGIREYLSERLARAIYGKDYNKHFLSKKKFVDQALFFDLYAEQLGKNVLLEVSNYCLENLRYLNPLPPPANPLTTPKDCFGPPKKGSGKLAEKEYLNDKCMEQLIEINYPLKENKNDPNIQKYLASVESLQKASKEEIQDQTPKYFKDKSKFCAIVVQSMCNRYKCQKGGVPLQHNECDEYNIPLTTKLTNLPADIVNQNNGSKACTVITRIREYKKTITQIQATKEKLIATGKKGSGYNTNVYYEGAYQGGKGEGEQSLSEIATVSSREITENSEIKDIYLTEEEAQELRTKCANNPSDPECEKLVDTELKEKNVALETAFEAETLVRKEELNKLKDNEEIKEYLDRLGLGNLYDESMQPDKLKKLIEAHYESEREAFIVEMRNKLKDKLSVQNDDGSKNDDEIKKAMMGTIDDLENQKDRLETILHYNNVITSFLETSEKDGSNASLNTVALQREMDDFEKYQDEKDKTDADSYFEQVTSGGQALKKSDATGLQYMDYIDSILGNSK